MTAFEQQVAILLTNGFGKEVKCCILCGTGVLSSDRFHLHYEGSTKIRAEITNDFNQSFGSGIDGCVSNSNNRQVDERESTVHLMIIPTAICGPLLLDPNSEIKPNLTAVFVNDIMIVPISLASLPSVSIPMYDDTFQYEKSHGDSYDHLVMVFKSLVLDYQKSLCFL